MAEINNSIALGVKPIDILTPLEQATRIQQMRATTAQTEQNTRRAAQKFQAQDTYNQLLQSGDKNALTNSGLAAHTEAYKSTAEALATSDANKRANLIQRLDVFGRAAEAVQQVPERDRPTAWNTQVKQLFDNEVIDKPTYNRLKDNYNPLTIAQLKAAGMAVKDHMAASGETAGHVSDATLAGDVARSQSRPESYQPGVTSITVPSGIRPNPAAPMAPGVYLNPEQQARRGAAGAAPGGNTATGAPTPGTPGSSAAPGAPGAPPAATQTGFESHPLWNQIPTLPGAETKNPNDVVSGRTPEMQARIAQGAKEYAETIRPAAEAAKGDRAQLGTMRSELASGDIDSSKLGPLRGSAASWVYGILGGGPRGIQVAKDITGTDPTKAEIFNKESVNRVLNFALQTEGARHAIQGTIIAMQANPNLANTKEANLKIIDIMDATAKYMQDRDLAAQAYAAKNGGRMDGFSTWYSKAHPLSSEISKIVPWQIPVWHQRKQGGGEETIWDTAKMENGVTYDVPVAGENGKELRDAKGNVVTQPMTFDAKKGGFMPIR